METRYLIISSMDINDLMERVNEMICLGGAKLVGGVAVQGALLLQAVTYESLGEIVSEAVPDTETTEKKKKTKKTKSDKTDD